MFPVAATNPVSFVPTVPVLPLDPVYSDNQTCDRKDMVHLTAVGATAVATVVAEALFGDAEDARWKTSIVFGECKSEVDMDDK